MKVLVTILILLFCAWCFICVPWYTCKIKGLCEDEDQIENVKGNLVFSRLSSALETNELSLLLIDSLKETTRDTLVINGLYFTDEPNGKKLGLDRAQEILGFLRANGLKDLVSLKSSKSAKTIGISKLRAVNFESIVNESIVEDTVTTEEAFEIKETNSKITINFPKASAVASANLKLTEALKEFAERAVSDNLNLEVTGHTDNSGSDETNQYYGMLRAEAITNMLISYGVSTDKIATLSRADSMPIASNDTAEGRKMNRRVEIIILK